VRPERLSLRVMDEQSQLRRKQDREDERERASTNLVLLLFFVAIVGIGIWLANAMLDARRADDCITQGRRNCNPIEAAPR
jgi:hypothetical protein